MFLLFRKEKNYNFLSLQPHLATYNKNSHDKKTHQHDCFKRHHFGFVHLEA